ncbi:MAG: type IV toxin-antitoxin system AbiEi family antitoxin domain-containing protein [Thermoleophilia bacterium]
MRNANFTVTGIPDAYRLLLEFDQRRVDELKKKQHQSTCRNLHQALVYAIEMDGRAGMDNHSTAAYVEELQAGGRYTFTGSEIAALVSGSDAAIAAALRRLKKKGRIASPRRGFYVIVPLEYRQAGCPPASWFIDDLMGFLGRPYYVGLLSAAAIHGAAHQQPMVFQVMTDAATRGATAGRVRVEFRMKSALESTPVGRIQTETGFMQVSTPEATAFDLVRFTLTAGGLNNVATVLGELADSLDSDQLGALSVGHRAPEVQRLGYLLDRLGVRGAADSLAAALSARRYRPVLLAPGGAAGGSVDGRWRVVLNESVEVDL